MVYNHVSLNVNNHFQCSSEGPERDPVSPLMLLYDRIQDITRDIRRETLPAVLEQSLHHSRVPLDLFHGPGREVKAQGANVDR